MKIKFNGGNRALLCDNCGTILATGDRIPERAPQVYSPHDSYWFCSADCACEWHKKLDKLCFIVEPENGVRPRPVLNPHEEVYRDVVSIMSDRLRIPEGEIKLDSILGIDFDMDSLDRVDLLIGLEYAFSIEIPDSAASTFVTVNDIVTYIETLTKKHEKI